MIKHIAFYGSLRKGFSNSLSQTALDSLEYIGPCTIRGKIYDLKHYPALKPGEGEVVGDLFRILDKSILPIIDAYELQDNSNPHLAGFKRKAVKLAAPKLVCWVYYYQGTVEPRQYISTGNWQNK